MDLSHRYFLILAAMLLLSAASLNAQQPAGGTLYGRVLDAATGEPLENVNVFLAQTVLGTSTDSQGHFSITRIPPGLYRVVASRIGYQMQTEHVTLRGSGSFRCEFRMPPRILQGKEVQATGEAQKDWKKQLEAFTEKFLGTGDYASLCRILNPHVLSFKVDSISRDLLASSEDLIDIENRALGYRVAIALGMFSWDLRRDRGQYLIYPRFEPLLTVRRDSLLSWEENRADSYDRSREHFFASLLAGTLEEENFEVFIGSLPYLRSGSRRSVGPGDIVVQNTDLWGLRRVMFNDWLLVIHSGENGAESNYLALDQGAVLVDSLGHSSDPLGIHVLGPWQERRVSDMLPLFWTRKRMAAE